MGGELTQFLTLKQYLLPRLKYGVQSIIASWVSAPPHVHLASIQVTGPTKASWGPWGILTTETKQACSHQPLWP